MTLGNRQRLLSFASLDCGVDCSGDLFHGRNFVYVHNSTVDRGLSAMIRSGLIQSRTKTVAKLRFVLSSGTQLHQDLVRPNLRHRLYLGPTVGRTSMITDFWTRSSQTFSPCQAWSRSRIRLLVEVCFFSSISGVVLTIFTEVTSAEIPLAVLPQSFLWPSVPSC